MDPQSLQPYSFDTLDGQESAAHATLSVTFSSTQPLQRYNILHAMANGHHTIPTFLVHVKHCTCQLFHYYPGILHSGEREGERGGEV